MILEDSLGYFQDSWRFMETFQDFSGFFRIFQDFFQRIWKSSSGFWRILEGLLEVAPRWRLGGKRVAAGWEPLGGREGGREGGSMRGQ